MESTENIYFSVNDGIRWIEEGARKFRKCSRLLAKAKTRYREAQWLEHESTTFILRDYKGGEDLLRLAVQTRTLANWLLKTAKEVCAQADHALRQSEKAFRNALFEAQHNSKPL